MSKKQKKSLVRILVSALLLLTAYLLTKFVNVKYIELSYLASYIVIALPILKKAGKNILHGQIFDENFLMSIATIGSIIIGEYPEATFVMLFYAVGELFESIATGKSRNSIKELMDIRPDRATVERNGEAVTVSPDEVEVGEILIVQPGEKIPLDSVVVSGTASLNTVALTGESTPKEVTVGDRAISGCINLNGVLRLKAEKPFGESTVSKILELVENSSSQKAKSENFITKFSKIYTPAVVALAAIVALVPPIFDGQWTKWIYQGLIMLVVSCPCALVLSVPLTFFGAIGGASKKGILIKGSNYIEALAKTDTVLFDKTGTLTKGNFKVTSGEKETLELAAAAEHFSNHPIAMSIKEAYSDIDALEISDVEEISGMGISVMYKGSRVLAGNKKLMDKFGITVQPEEGTVVYVAKDGAFAGTVKINDEIKPESFEAIENLRKNGIKTVMLTGDSKSIAESVSRSLKIDEFKAELLPGDKAEIMASYGEHTAFAGDGINDAPSLARAGVGIAMGSMGSDAAIEAADVVIMDDKPTKIWQAICLSRKTRVIVGENIVFALIVKISVLILSALGIVNMGAAIFADVGVLVLAVLNAMRTLRFK